MDGVGVSGYGDGVRQLIAKLGIIFAVLLMPFGMTPASGAVHGGMTAAMEHCPQPHSSKHARRGAMDGCTMACASALPAVDLVRAERVALSDMPVAAPVVAEFHGLHPDTATPPPRRG